MKLSAIKKSKTQFLKNLILISLGAFLAAVSIQIFLLPNHLIDGGIVGISLICARVFGSAYLPIFLVVFNIPFIYLAYKYIRKSFVIYMLFAVFLFAGFLASIHHFGAFTAEPLEAIVFGGAILGCGIGLIIRCGGCTDGTEILAIIINRKKGFTVGQVVFVVNIFIFSAYGWIFKDWHIALKSLMTYVVAFKVMDMVITGLDEMKSVMIISKNVSSLQKIIMHELGLGLTIIKGKGGFTGQDQDILFVIVERLDLAELKELILQEDPTAFIAIENLHEVAYGGLPLRTRKSKKKIHLK